MKLKLGVIAFVAMLLSAVFLAPMSAEAAQPSKGSVNVPVTQTVTDPVTNSVLGTLNGTATITNFVVQNGVLTAVGNLTGTFTPAGGGAAVPVNQAFATPVQAAGSCTILDLTLGPINLNLLGLVVQTNAIHLQITAQQGPGNLLGNLLCAVANLLNNNGPLTGISNLLNRILGILNGLTL